MTEQTNTGAGDTSRTTLGEEFCNFVSGLMPPENVRQHLRNSRIEVLKAMRAMIDHRIDRLSNRGGPKGTPFTVE